MQRQDLRAGVVVPDTYGIMHGRIGAENGVWTIIATQSYLRCPFIGLSSRNKERQLRSLTHSGIRCVRNGERIAGGGIGEEVSQINTCFIRLLTRVLIMFK